MPILRPLFNISFLAFAALMLGYAVTMGMQVGPPAGGAWDFPSSPAPAPGPHVSVPYVTGGAAGNERAEIERQRDAYDLHLALGQARGALPGEMSVAIDSVNGPVLPETESGPLFYAALPPGSYRVAVANGDRVRKLNIVIKRGHPLYLAQVW